MTRDPIQQVLDTLHEYTNLCVGADTCAAREAIEPLVRAYEAQTENYREENEARAAAQAKVDQLTAELSEVRSHVGRADAREERIKEMEITIGAERALKRDLEMKLSEADLLAEQWRRSLNRLVKTMGADLKQVLNDG